MTLSLERLPVELLLNILRECREVADVHNLAHASRTLLSIFEYGGVGVVEAVLESATPEPMHSYMRAVLRLRTGQYGTYHLVHVMDRCNFYSPPVKHKVSPEVLRKFTRLAVHMRASALSYLEGCAAKCHLAPLLNVKLPLLPSQLEKQRTMLAFWRAQHFRELQIALLENRIDWPERELNSLKAATVDMCETISFLRAQGLLTAADPLEAQEKALDCHDSDRQATEDSKRNRFASLACYFSGHSMLWGRDQSDVVIEPHTGRKMLVRLIIDGRSDLVIPCLGLMWTYGLMSWDSRTTANMGLNPLQPCDDYSRYYAVWDGLLTPEENALIR